MRLWPDGAAAGSPLVLLSFLHEELDRDLTKAEVVPEDAQQVSPVVGRKGTRVVTFHHDGRRLGRNLRGIKDLGSLVPPGEWRRVFFKGTLYQPVELPRADPFMGLLVQHLGVVEHHLDVPTGLPGDKGDRNM